MAKHKVEITGVNTANIHVYYEKLKKKYTKIFIILYFLVFF